MPATTEYDQYNGIHIYIRPPFHRVPGPYVFFPRPEHFNLLNAARCPHMRARGASWTPSGHVMDWETRWPTGRSAAGKIQKRNGPSGGRGLGKPALCMPGWNYACAITTLVFVFAPSRRRLERRHADFPGRAIIGEAQAIFMSPFTIDPAWRSWHY